MDEVRRKQKEIEVIGKQDLEIHACLEFIAPRFIVIILCASSFYKAQFIAFRDHSAPLVYLEL